MYAPEFLWVFDQRMLDYQFQKAEEDEEEDTPPPPPFFVRTYDPMNSGSGSISEISSTVSLGSLRSRLHSEVSFPNRGSLAKNWLSYPPPISNSATSSGTDGGSASLAEMQARLFAIHESPAKPVTRYLTVAHGIGSNISLESREFNIGAGGFISGPEIFGDYPVSNGYRNVNEFYRVDFRHAWQDMTGADPTAGELWRSVPQGGTIECNFTIDGMPDGISSLLEIHAESSVTLSGHELPSNDRTFTIKGVTPTGIEGARIVIRLKSNPAVIFATMRVQVLAQKIVPVTIFRVYDSRKPNSVFSDGPTGQQVVDQLNYVYYPQANIIFTLKRITTIDLGETSGPPVLFEADGSFDSDANLEELDLIARDKTSTTGFTIHIVKNMPANDGGASGIDARTCIVGASSPMLGYPHEVGHALGLVQRGVVNGGVHDIGPWPHEWKIEKAYGLMFPFAGNKMKPWIRQQDWFRANDSADELNKDQ